MLNSISNLPQSTIHQLPLYAIFLDLHKAYDSLDRGRTIEILRWYGVGPRIIQLLRTFWTSQHSAVRQGGYHSGTFQVERGVTQSDIPSPTIFNIVVDAIVRYWTAEVVGDQADIDRCDTWPVVSSTVYIDDGLLTSHAAEKLQSTYTLLRELFALMNLNSNTEKTKSMVFLPQSVYDGISGVAYNRRMSGDEESYESRKRIKVQCPRCEKAMAYSSLANHLLRLRGIQLWVFEWSTTSPNNQPSTRFKVSVPLYCKSKACPSQGRPGK
jgi:hypothetical protein